jgi:glutathione S-transferase
MATATLSLSSKNYSSWSFRAWLIARMSGVKFKEVIVPPGDTAARAEILLLSPSILVPCLTYDGVRVWDTLAIAEFLNEVAPKAGLLPKGRAERAHCRSICGEMHSGFVSLRSALPMNLKGQFKDFKVWSKAQSDIERITAIWRECLGAYGGPWLFGDFSIADAMYAPVATRFQTYDVKLDPVCAAYAKRILAHPFVVEWIEAAKLEKEEIEELEVEF